MVLATTNWINTQLVTAFVTGVFGPLVVLWIRYIIDKRKAKPDMLKDALEISSQVTSKLDTIREEFDADRIWIIQFHNGGHFYPTGKSIAKFSMFYETVAQGADSIQNNFQNIPVNLFSRSLNHVLEDSILSIQDFKDETIATYGLKYIAEETGCKSGYGFAIKTIEGKFIGVMGVDYTKRKHKLTEDDIHQLLMYASAIGGVLNNHLY